ncbi:hypothetical protein [Tenggerimyces flavus]|uniref:tRNA-guanine(15) transglycosylase-like domain-containing protein n=1 Tax=Tenggerimyces flavus TaxID=1708749 RepID=A0ABV7YJW1_9ACTN|nr:hypothetical protein [Tenggerimyces flavus]MBM7784798.1 hypothetical protein [Tenggerimyces flavus]
MAIGATVAKVGTRRGVVSAYVSGESLELVREARRIAGRVTLVGKSGLKAITQLSRARDLENVDLDPGTYVGRSDPPEGLLPLDWDELRLDWEKQQRLHRLDVVRAEGTFVPKGDFDALREAFTKTVDAGAVRVVSLHGWWLHSAGLQDLLVLVRHCDEALGFVLAGLFDPLEAAGAVDGLRELLDEASPTARRVELLRTDLAGIGFAAAGGALGSIGLGTSSRHHGLPLLRQAREAYEQRKGIPRVFVPALLAWKKGTELGALAPFDGAGITNCSCLPCDGRDLLRFDQEYKGNLPAGVREDARAHDLYTVFELAKTVLNSRDPLATWVEECRRAERVALGIHSAYRIDLTVPPSVRAWK